MSQIIVCREKHATRYWDASTPEAFAASALAILTQRWEEGHWYYKPEELFDDDERSLKGLLGDLWPADIGQPGNDEADRQKLKEAIEQLKDKWANAYAEDDPEYYRRRRRRLDALKRAINEYTEMRKYALWYAAAEKVVKDQDTGTITRGRGKYERQEPKAWYLLEQRSDHEYEGIELETLEQGKPVAEAVPA